MVGRVCGCPGLEDQLGNGFWEFEIWGLGSLMMAFLVVDDSLFVLTSRAIMRSFELRYT
jgi:hypothetical protein